METQSMEQQLLEEAKEIISAVNWKSLPFGGFEKAMLWLAEYEVYMELMGDADNINIKPDEIPYPIKDWVADQADAAYDALTGISEDE
jgi:hypothetical protein